jgi:hypothetical protein
MGSSYPMIFYCFSCPPVYYIRNTFLILITLTCLLAFAIFMIPKFGSSEYRKFRGNVFVLLGISAAAPFVYL